MNTPDPHNVAGGLNTSVRPTVVDRATWQAVLNMLRVREKAHTRAGDAIAAARRWLPMVEMDPAIALIGEQGPVTLLEVFEGRRQLIASFHETYWTTGRGNEVMAPSYGLLDLTAYGRQEFWEDSPEGWPQRWDCKGEQFRTHGRPTAQWSRLAAGRSDDLGTGAATTTPHCCQNEP